MIKRTRQWFKGLSVGGKAIAIVVASLVGLSAISVAASDNQNPKPPQLESANTSASQNEDVVTHQTVTETEEIPFTTTQVRIVP